MVDVKYCCQGALPLKREHVLNFIQMESRLYGETED